MLPPAMSTSRQAPTMRRLNYRAAGPSGRPLRVCDRQWKVAQELFAPCPARGTGVHRLHDCLKATIR